MCNDNYSTEKAREEREEALRKEEECEFKLNW